MKKAITITDYIENINGLKFVCPICVKYCRLSGNNASHERYMHAQKQFEKGLFESLRKEIKADVKKQHDLYVNNLVGDIKANPRTSTITLTVKRKTRKVSHLYRGEMAAVWQNESWNRQMNSTVRLQNVFNKTEHTQVPLPNRLAPFMEDIYVLAEGVTKLLEGLNPSKALGPDELHPRVLKELASKLGPMFAHLFQQSIDTGEIPMEWSLANMCPLYKKGDRSLACNYRPVSLTCVPCKLP